MNIWIKFYGHIVSNLRNLGTTWLASKEIQGFARGKQE